MFIDPTPHLDVIEKLSHVIGIPAIVGAIVWLVRTYDASVRQLKDIHEGTEKAIKTTAEVKASVDTIQNNHMAHLSADLKEQTALLTNMDKSLAIIADRTARPASRRGASHAVQA